MHCAKTWRLGAWFALGMRQSCLRLAVTRHARVRAHQTLNSRVSSQHVMVSIGKEDGGSQSVNASVMVQGEVVLSTEHSVS